MRALLGGARADDLVDAGVVVQVPDELGDPLVRVGHVGVGPDDDPAVRLAGADPPGGARPAVGAERHEPHVRERRQRLLQHRERVVGRLVVDDEQLVAVAAGVHRRGDPLDLLHHVVLLVVAGQHDRHVEGVRPRRRQWGGSHGKVRRRRRSSRRSRGPTVPRLASQPMSQPPDAPRVTVVVVTWQGRHLLGRVPGVAPRRRRSDTAWSSWTTPPPTGRRSSSPPSHPEATVVVSTGTKASPAAWPGPSRSSTRPYVALLNNDATADPDWLAALRRARRTRTPTAAAVTSRMLLADRRRHAQQRRACCSCPAATAPTADSASRDTAYPRAGRGVRLQRRRSPAAHGRRPRRGRDAASRSSSTTRTPTCPGGCGWPAGRSATSPGAVVRHLHSATADQRSESFAYFNERNRLLTLVRCAPAGMAAGRPWPLPRHHRLARPRGASAGGGPRRGRASGCACGSGRFGSFLRLAPWALRSRRAILRDARLSPRQVAGGLGRKGRLSSPVGPPAAAT